MCVPNYPRKQSRLYKQRRPWRKFCTAFYRDATDYTTVYQFDSAASEIQPINHTVHEKFN